MGPLIKAVFLIDTASYPENDSRDASRAHSICLSSLRLLLSLSSDAEKSGTVNKSKITQTKVKWGYKFFSSKSVRTKIELHKFLDFKLKYVEEYENELFRRFETSSLPTTSTVKAAACLTKALTELLSDFPWEGPDITSPVKGQKRINYARSKNIVYLFTRCPKSPIQLKQFSGKQVPDADVFLDSFLPPRLLQELRCTSNLSLNWIDTSSNDSRKDVCGDLLSLKIVESAVLRTGGNVYPLDSIIQSGSPYYVDVQNLITDPGSEGTVKLAKKSVFDHSSSLLPISSTLTSTSNDNIPDSCGFKTVLKIGASDVCLEVYPSTQSDAGKRFQEPLSDATELQRLTSKGLEALEDHHLPTTLRAYSLLEKSSSFQTLMLKYCYIGSESVTSNASGNFRKLLTSLVTRSCDLVLSYEKTGQLVILEPLTLDTACIYPLSAMKSLSLEKILIRQHSNQDPDQPRMSAAGIACDDLVQKLVAGKKSTPVAGFVQPVLKKTATLDGKLMDRWHIPGNKSSFRSLIQKLNLRIKELEFLTTDETAMLKQLQKAYKEEKKPPGVRDTPVLPQHNDSISDSKAEDKFDLPFKGKKSRTSISRAEMILSKSKEVVKVRDNSAKDEKNKDKQGKDKPSVTTQVADFKNVDELKQYLKSTYDRSISGESSCVDVNVQTTVTVALHYLRENGTDNPEEECSQVLNDCLVISSGALREKYNNQGDINTEQKIAEYQFQIVLRLEMASTLVNKDQTLGEEDVNDEVVGMLRTLSFMCDPGTLSKFMEICLLYNYMHTIPKTLANIYDELMQPLPDALSNILSPHNSSAEQSVFNSSLMSVGGPPSTRTRSHGSVGPPSNQPGSNVSVNLDTSTSRPRGGRRLSHHPSLADFGSKRQIVIEKAPTQKEEKVSRKRKRSGKQGRKDKVAKSLFDKSRGTKLERRQSVAVMQSTGTQKTPKKGPARLLFKSPVANKTRLQSLVAETPQHKQLSRSLCLPNPDEDDRGSQDVVEESPVKSISETTKDTPTKGKRAKALMRRSFYSAGPIKRTRNMTEYFQLADRIAGRKRTPPSQPLNKLPKLLSMESDKQFKSPEKNSSFLLSQLVFSPSPSKYTPKKLNQTPSKLLIGSPSQNTRSRNPSGVVGNPLGLFGSPNPKSSTKKKIESPSSRILESPVSRRDSPRVLVAESTTKMEDESERVTPEKSPICGVITTGLDSPSHNTRLKTTATPTRRSVRAALFSKSPAPNRTFSPRAVNASPRTLLSKFESPRKQAAMESIIASPRKNLRSGLETVSSQTTNSVQSTSNTNNLEQSGSTKKSCSEKVQKTPSPHAKKAQTPDSFDKWHRRKPRNQISPAPEKKDSVTVDTEYTRPNKSRLKSVNNVKSPLRKKRTLILSPERPTESPSKRRRTNKLDSLSSLGKGSLLNSTLMNEGSQGFDINSSIELSQISAVSSLDYFSSANDEVFADSQKSANFKSSQNVDDLEIENIENSLVRRVKSKDGGSAFMRHKTLEKVCSTEFPSSAESARSESPIFFSSVRKTPRHRHVSGDKGSVIQNIENIKADGNHSPVDSKGASPKFGKSPNGNKYSPNVSAKSLMHLMNSPLLHASEKSEAKSRRSLRLQN